MSDRKWQTTGANENRAFGRRNTVRHAWISAGQRSRIPCCIRNLSVGGALLEMEVPGWLPYNFDLHIEDPKLVVGCEVRHRGQYGVGVAFLNNMHGLMLLDPSMSAQPADAGEYAPDPAVFNSLLAELRLRCTRAQAS